MRILLPNDDSIPVYQPLAREIGLYEALVLLKLESGIAELGMVKDGHRMIARTKQELYVYFASWLSKGKVDKILDSLHDRGFIFIVEGTFEDTHWYALNFDKLRSLKSVAILAEDEIADMHVPMKSITREVSSVANGHSEIYKEIYGALLVVGNFKTELLGERVRREIGSATKKIISFYPDREIAHLKLMVLGYRQWWCEIAYAPKVMNPPQPVAVLSGWGNYEKYCKEHLHGKPPQIPEEWLRS